jgi:MbtH protein
MNQEQDENAIYKVVVNHEEQYSIWPAEREIPQGWREAGKTGSKQECLEFIETNWTDMRPLNLRNNIATPSSDMTRPPTFGGE